MKKDFSVFGDEIRIRKGSDSEYFPLYLERFENGICTLVAGFDNRVELMKRMAELLEHAPIRRDNCWHDFEAGDTLYMNEDDKDVVKPHSRECKVLYVTGDHLIASLVEAPEVTLWVDDENMGTLFTANPKYKVV